MSTGNKLVFKNILILIIGLGALGGLIFYVAGKERIATKKYATEPAYVQFLKDEGEGKRLVFGEGCMINPKELVLENKDVVMFENESGEVLLFKMLGDKYQLQPHSYFIQEVNVPHTPAQFQIGCPTGVDRVGVYVKEETSI